MNPLPVGVIGVGHLGGSHVRKYLDMPEADLAGVWDIDENVREAIPEKYGAKVFDSLDSLLSSVQAVSIVVPSSVHAEVAEVATGKGVHIFVEKPIASDLEAADRIIEAAGKNDLKLQVGHIERFNSAFRSLQKISTGAVKPRFIESHRLAQFNPRGMDVSVILDLMIHDIDLVLKLMDSPLERIDASGVGVISDTVDIVNVRMSFADGAAANITASRISVKQMRKMRLFQKDSYVSMDFIKGETEVFQITDSDKDFAEKGVLKLSDIDLENGKGSKKIGYKKILNDGNDALELELRSFIEAIHSNGKPLVTGEEARDALKIAIHIAEKAG